MWQDMVTSGTPETFVIAVAFGNGKYGKKQKNPKSKTLFASNKDMVRGIVYRQVYDAYTCRKTCVIGVSRDYNVKGMIPVVYTPKFGKDFEPILDRLGSIINKL